MQLPMDVTKTYCHQNNADCAILYAEVRLSYVKWQRIDVHSVRTRMSWVPSHLSAGSLVANYMPFRSLGLGYG